MKVRCDDSKKKNRRTKEKACIRLLKFYVIFMDTLNCILYCRLWLLLRRAMKVHSWRKERKLCWSLTSSRGIIKAEFSELYCNTGVFSELWPPKGCAVLLVHILQMVCSNQSLPKNQN